MKNNNLKFKIYFLVIVFSFAFLVFNLNNVKAAGLFFESVNQELAQEEEFLVSIFLDTAEESINAVEAKISFSEDLLILKEIRDGNSAINFWIKRPKIEKAGIIDFSGIIPGGYQEAKGFLFSVVFQTKKSGSGDIEIKNAKVLRNDGKGTAAPLTISNFQFLISNKISSSKLQIPNSDDIDPPEPFTPEISSDPNMFNGQWFLVFTAQDKGSGIDHYKVCERTKTTCVITESPYVLQNQNLDRKILVKAIDKNGNERIAVLLPKFAPLYKKWPVYIILGMSVLGVIILIRWLWRKNIKYRE